MMPYVHPNPRDQIVPLLVSGQQRPQEGPAEPSEFLFLCQNI